MIDMHPSPLFLADSHALDFLNTLTAPMDEEVEWLGDGRQLLAWLEAAGLVDPAVLQEVRASATPEELDKVAAQARSLREWFREFVTRHRGKPLSWRVLAELEPLNLLLARDERFSQIAARPKARAEDGHLPLALVAQRRWRTAEALLLPVADAIAQLLTSADFTDVKRCEWPSCVLHFLDTTRGRRRRWCCMAVCGNRAKQASYRNRKAPA